MFFKPGKYAPFAFPPEFDPKWTTRSWPSKKLYKVPKWCAVDLRDGNQALHTPMDMERKLNFFKHLVKLGFKEIEVGFPSASTLEYNFCRELITQGLIPDDVFVQVLCQCREDLLKQTFRAIAGARNVIIHIYNSTSEVQRRVVFQKDQEGIKQIALSGLNDVVQLMEAYMQTNESLKSMRLEYSPESFSQTEPLFALDISNLVLKAWRAAAASHPQMDEVAILNLPATVEASSPNVYADQIEWMAAHLEDRHLIEISVHPHNDRGTAVAAAELGLLAGADRVEGCLFGNGERTGNVCLLTLAMNFYTQGIDPGLDFSDMAKVIEVYEESTRLSVPDRHPWSGSLVFTAYSGSHQDAIKKGLQNMKTETEWNVPYLPLDPKDIGRDYEAVIRVNSQSGKSGIAFILEQQFGIIIPKRCQIEFSKSVSAHVDTTAAEVKAQAILEIFNHHFLIVEMNEQETEGSHIRLIDYEWDQQKGMCKAHLRGASQDFKMESTGNGPISAFLNGLNQWLEGPQLNLLEYSETAICGPEGGEAKACSAICLAYEDISRFGVGIHANVLTSAFHSLLSSFNQLRELKTIPMRACSSIDF